MAEPSNLRRLGVHEQPHDRLYRMSIRFITDAPLPGGDVLKEILGESQNLVIPDALVVRVRQTVPFIPDEPTLNKYAEAVGEGRPARFDGYDYIYPVVATDAASVKKEETS